MINITEIRISKIENDEKLRAFASVVVDGCFLIGDFRIVEGEEGYFVSMPSKRKKDGNFKETAYPLDPATRSALEERILLAYEQSTGCRAISRIEKGEAETIRPDLLCVEEFGCMPK